MQTKAYCEHYEIFYLENDINKFNKQVIQVDMHKK